MPTPTKIRNFDDLMAIMPKQAAPTYDLAGIQQSIANYSAELNKILSKNSTDFTPSGQSSWGNVQYQNVDPTKSAGDATAFNMNNLGYFNSMANSINQANLAARQNQLDVIDPGWREARDVANKTNMAWQRGEVGKDVSDKLARDNAFAAVMSGGYGGAQNARAATARDFGLTQMNLQQQGQDASAKWTGMLSALLPNLTTGADVMQFSGLSAKDVISTQLQNADRNLSAQTANSTGRQNAAQFNIDADFRAKQALAGESLDYARVAAQGLNSIAELSTSNITNKYAADLNYANTMYANQYRPWAMVAERVGTQIGQQNSWGYGI